MNLNEIIALTSTQEALLIYSLLGVFITTIIIRALRMRKTLKQIRQTMLELTEGRESYIDKHITRVVTEVLGAKPETLIQEVEFVGNFPDPSDAMAEGRHTYSEFAVRQGPGAMAEEWEQYIKWVDSCIIGEPQPVANLHEGDLKAAGMVGIYARRALRKPDGPVEDLICDTKNLCGMEALCAEPVCDKEDPAYEQLDMLEDDLRGFANQIFKSGDDELAQRFVDLAERVGSIETSTNPAQTLMDILELTEELKELNSAHREELNLHQTTEERLMQNVHTPLKVTDSNEFWGVVLSRGWPLEVIWTDEDGSENTGQVSDLMGLIRLIEQKNLRAPSTEHPLWIRGVRSDSVEVENMRLDSVTHTKGSDIVEASGNLRWPVMLEAEGNPMVEIRAIGDLVKVLQSDFKPSASRPVTITGCDRKEPPGSRCETQDQIYSAFCQIDGPCVLENLLGAEKDILDTEELQQLLRSQSTLAGPSYRYPVWVRAREQAEQVEWDGGWVDEVSDFVEAEWGDLPSHCVGRVLSYAKHLPVPVWQHRKWFIVNNQISDLQEIEDLMQMEATDIERVLFFYNVIGEQHLRYLDLVSETGMEPAMLSAVLSMSKDEPGEPPVLLLQDPAPNQEGAAFPVGDTEQQQQQQLRTRINSPIPDEGDWAFENEVLSALTKVEHMPTGCKSVELLSLCTFLINELELPDDEVIELEERTEEELDELLQMYAEGFFEGDDDHFLTARTRLFIRALHRYRDFREGDRLPPTFDMQEIPVNIRGRVSQALCRWLETETQREMRVVELQEIGDRNMCGWSEGYCKNLVDRAYRATKQPEAAAH